MSTENLGLDTRPLRTGGEDSILAGIWRTVLSDLDVDATTMFDKIDRYATKVSKEFPEKAAQIRGNLRQDVNKQGMTWFTFTKCLRVLGVQRFEIEFTLHHIQNVTHHTLKVALKDDFFSSKEKEEKDPTTLSSFFKDIQHRLGIGIREFEILLDYYMRREKLIVNLRNKTNIRGYLKKDFSATKMSWRNFMKALVFLCVIKMDLKLTLHFSKFDSSHMYPILLGDMEDYQEELKNDLSFGNKTIVNFPVSS